MNKTICVIGNFRPLASGIRWQDDVLSDCIEREWGFRVIRVSRIQNRFLRPVFIFFTLLRYILSAEIVIVNAFSYLNFINAAIAIMIGRFAFKKVCVVYRGGWAKEFIKRFGFIVRKILLLADEIIVPSKYLENIFISYGLKVKRINNILTGNIWVPNDFCTPAYRIAWARSLFEIYNPQLAIETVRMLQQRGIKVELYLAGRDGGLKTHLIQKIKDYKLQDVYILGLQSQLELNKVYKRCSIFINTSHADNQPLSVLEAMRCGLAVISTNVGGVSEILINDKNGVLVDDNNAEQMASAIVRLVENPETYHRIVENGFKTVAEYSFDKVKEKWKAVLFDE